VKAAKPAKTGRRISAAGRKAMSEVSKKRWAAQRKATTPKRVSAAARGMSSAARKRIAEAMRKKVGGERKRRRLS
jgi:predicted ribonuclease toxin of YeeF-YezG toxin-antitoxin module